MTAHPARPGHPRAMNVANVQAILTHLALGHSRAAAAAAAELSPDTVQKWIRRGIHEADRLAALGLDPGLVDVADPVIAENERAFFVFARQVRLAEDEAIRQVESPLLRAGSAEGFDVETKTVETQVRNPETGEMVTTARTVTTKRVVDLQTVRWLAERLDPERYHLPTQVQVSGIGGGDLHVAEMTERQAEALNTLLRVYTDALLELAPPRTRDRMAARIPDAIQAALDAISTETTELPPGGPHA